MNYDLWRQKKLSLISYIELYVVYTQKNKSILGVPTKTLLPPLNSCISTKILDDHAANWHKCVESMGPWGMPTIGWITAKMRQLVVVRRICCCSQSMIFLLELLGPAKQPMACPSSSNRKIINWEQQQIILSITNCLILPVIFHNRQMIRA